MEGFGIVYLEANAAGTPVLATRTGGIADAVADGRSGYFAASPTPSDIAHALRRFLSGAVQFEPGLVRAWAEAHRYENVAERLERVYECVLPSVEGGIAPDSAGGMAAALGGHVCSSGS